MRAQHGYQQRGYLGQTAEGSTTEAWGVGAGITGRQQVPILFFPTTGLGRKREKSQVGCAGWLPSRLPGTESGGDGREGMVGC